MAMPIDDIVIAVVGLGYVGLPLAVEFGKRYRTVGYDVSAAKLAHYRHHRDPTGEVAPADFAAATRLSVTTEASALADADVIIVAVPTPVDVAHAPDFSPLVGASSTVGRHMKRGAIVVYESTVYPGATEEVCIPLLEQHSGMTWRRDFHVGYSPERVNPGDRERTITRIVKVVSGDDAATLDTLAALYASIITAGVHRAASIKVAEAAKVIENTQRDLNIALMNEIALICDRLGIRTSDVLAAAGTKWNFLRFTPGLVGGHCIGVDPYYLTTIAEHVGYQPEVILAGRRINNRMGEFVAGKLVKLLINADLPVKGARVGILGLTFKEDVSDLRNSRVPDIVRELGQYGIAALVNDPMCSPDSALREYGIALCSLEELTGLDALILAVPHARYLDARPASIGERVKPGGVLMDLKSVLPSDSIPSGVHLWSL
jgi:UDP-N-acetyl-D-galactosamine dehydrogenase